MKYPGKKLCAVCEANYHPIKTSTGKVATMCWKCWSTQPARVTQFDPTNAKNEVNEAGKLSVGKTTTEII